MSEPSSHSALAEIAIIGAGLVTQTIHLLALLNPQSYFNVLYVCDLSISLAKRVAKKYHI